MSEAPPLAPQLPPSSPARLAAVQAAATMWSGQLIDLGGRNSLLYYHDLRAGTLDLTGASSVALSGVLAGHTIRLSALFPGETTADAARRARTISAKARENLEERGLATLYVGRGMATWNTQGSTVSTPAAPVLLAQASLRPVGALEADFELTITDEWEPNPTLLHLLRSSFRVDIDATDLLAAIEDAADDLDAAQTALAAAAALIDGFSVTARTVVGNFSYAKQPMVLDLEGALDVMVGNDTIAALAGDRDAISTLRAASIGIGLDQPDRIPPSDEFLAIDADASQNYVINAALEGANLVVQGPPGTGKSQTIANLIATLSARGRSVLFVAEKRAAIDAVLNRLQRVGLGDLVLDLYGGGGSRRKMAAELRRVYDATATVPPVHRDGDDARLMDLRNRLNRHAHAIHDPRPPWQVNVYDLQARLLGVPEGLRAPLRLAAPRVAVLDDSVLRSVGDALADWVTTGGPAVERRTSAWAAAAATITNSQAAETALNLARTLANVTLPDATVQLEATIASCSLRRPLTVGSWNEMLLMLQQVADVSELFDATIWTHDLDGIAIDLLPATKGPIGRTWATLFNGRYRRAAKLLGSIIHEPTNPPAVHAIVTTASVAKAGWAKVTTDGRGPTLAEDLAGTIGAYQRLTIDLGSLGAYVGTSSLIDTDLAETKRAIDALLADAATLFRLPKLHDLASQIDLAGFDAVRTLVGEHNVSAGAVRHVVEYVACASILEQIQLTDPDIGAFDGATHSSYVIEFAEADRKHIGAGAAKVRRAVAEHLVDVRNAHADGDALIAAEVRKKSRHRTLRELTQIAPEVLLALKPCWAMSPLAVSQLLDAKPLFDVVIFDEASQVPPADAVPALMRARQAIVAGDSKQLPPTAFFASTSSSDDSGDDDGGTDSNGGTESDPGVGGTESDPRVGVGNLTVGTESVLDAMANVVTAGSMTLRWHYRSRDERLIAFSNAQPSLYDWQMVTFPGTSAPGTNSAAIRHVHVPWRADAGHIESNADDTSSDEVARVVELIAEHARSHPEQTLGVIAMGVKHADRVGEALRRARHEDPVLDAFCASHPDELMFVKNLERVQGDERDAIILTIGYGKNASGAMQYRFGPINTDGGERRLNVAVTRARSRMTVVSSFVASDLDPAKLRSEGAQMLGRYIAYAASGGSDLGPVVREHPPLNSFEADVRDRLQAAGIALVAQLGVSGYYIDCAACHPERPGEFVLAIEADGASYHSANTARERDRLRQEHLERLGWRFHRIWSTDWFRNREAEIVKVTAAWRAACASADAALAGVSPAAPVTVPTAVTPGPPRTWSAPSVPATSTAPPLTPDDRRTGGRPPIEPGQSISEYTDTQLVSIVTWVASDGLLRTDSELQTEVRMEMGFKRRGPQIVERLDRAIGEFRRRSES